MPGYPMQSPDDNRIALLAFYLQLPEGFSENVVPKDVLIDIVNSDRSSIGGSLNGTILRVQPLLKTTPGTFNGKQTDDEGGEESEHKNATIAIIGASTAGVVFLLVIVALILTFKKGSKG